MSNHLANAGSQSELVALLQGAANRWLLGIYRFAGRKQFEAYHPAKVAAKTCGQIAPPVF